MKGIETYNIKVNSEMYKWCNAFHYLTKQRYKDYQTKIHWKLHLASIWENIQ